MKSIVLNENTGEFARQVDAASHSDLNRCWHCLACTNGCPFSRDMDIFPNQVIRMVQLGLKERVLKSSAIWLCVGCNTCSVECPNAIDIAAVMDTLRQMAVEEGIDVAEPGILAFHEAVIGSLSRYGRTHKLEIMMRYKLSGNSLFADLDVGLKMLARRKLHLFPSKVRDRNVLKMLFEQEVQNDLS